jgi:4-amino-4-deoxy-L-arabinose transferase-like glycosyltransferase
MQTKQFPFWLIVCSLIILLTLPLLFGDGMFLDGLFYTVVSKNMANGLGSFWSLYYSEAGFSGLRGYHEDPPLVFGIQALFFRLLGNGMYTERIYVLVTLVVTVLLIVAVWRKAVDHSVESKSGWLPLLLWITTPLVFWSFSNNMLENTMGIFVLLSAWFYLRSLEKKSRQLLMLLLSGISIFLASFCKGIPGLFILAAPFLYWLCTRRISFARMWAHSVVLFSIVTVIYLVLLLFPAARESLSIYFFKRALYRIENNPIVNSHFWIVRRLGPELTPSLIMIAFIYLLAVLKTKYRIEPERFRIALFFILIGLAGTAPLMLTKVQRGFYAVPAFPFLAIGFSLLVSQPVAAFTAKLSQTNWPKYLSTAGALILTTALTLTFLLTGKARRDEEMLNDIYAMGRHLKARSTIGVPSEKWNESTFGAYFMRYFEISMLEGNSYRYYVAPTDFPRAVPDGFEKVSLGTIKYDLYIKK